MSQKIFGGIGQKPIHCPSESHLDSCIKFAVVWVLALLVMAQKMLLEVSFWAKIVNWDFFSKHIFSKENLSKCFFWSRPALEWPCLSTLDVLTRFQRIFKISFLPVIFTVKWQPGQKCLHSCWSSNSTLSVHSMHVLVRRYHLEANSMAKKGFWWKISFYNFSPKWDLQKHFLGHRKKGWNSNNSKI